MHRSQNSQLKQRIRALGERLDSHRKRQQEQHPGLTLTGIYNVLEKLRSGEPLTAARLSSPNAKEKQIHDQGLVTVLRQIHDELDEAVLEAYGWGDLAGTALPPAMQPALCVETTPLQAAVAFRSGPANESPLSCANADENKDSPILVPCAGPPGMQDERQRDSINREALSAWPEATRSLPGDALLTRLVALNHERTAEEKRGLIRWLRPDYQNPSAAKAPAEEQTTLAGTESASSLKTENSQLATPAWPDKLPDQVAILRKLIATGDKNVAVPYDAESLSALFGRKNKKRTEQIEGILETLKGLGQL